MKPLYRAFAMFIRQIFSDNMLWAVCIAPLLTACLFRFGIPYLEALLSAEFQKPVLTDYYLLFDLFLSLITSYMFCYASSMVMLSEYDDNMTGYMSVTPVGKGGYIISRLGIPAFLSFFVSVLLMLFFTLAKWPLWLLLMTCLLNCALSIAVSLLIFSLSRNRVQGMAMAKMSGLFMLGLFAPFFLKSDIQYLLSPLPSFWLAKLCVDRNVLFLLPATLTLAVWLKLLTDRFRRKLAK